MQKKIAYKWNLIGLLLQFLFLFFPFFEIKFWDLKLSGYHIVLLLPSTLYDYLLNGHHDSDIIMFVFGAVILSAILLAVSSFFINIKRMAVIQSVLLVINTVIVLIDRDFILYGAYLWIILSFVLLTANLLKQKNEGKLSSKPALKTMSPHD